MNLACDILEILHVMGQNKAPQGKEVTMILIFNIDCSPGVFSSSDTLSTFILNYNIGTNNCKRHKIVFRICFVTWKLINRYIAFLELFQYLKRYET